MIVAVTGAAGMIGRRFTDRLAADGRLGDTGIERLELLDVVAAQPPAGLAATVRTGDLTDPGVAEALVAARPEVIVHLAAVVSGEAEDDLEKGYRTNLDGTRALLDAIRAAPGYRPRLVFASSIAVFGAPLPDPIPEDYATTPLTSYGTQKAIGELLVSDLSRRGVVDGIAIRLPTICIRPGTPNRAASGFFSGILREPLAGQEAVLPVAETVRHWHASPRSAVGFLVHAATLDTELLGGRRVLTMPGLSATVGEQIEALRRVAGEAAVKLIRREPDPAIERIVAGWPQRLDATRAESLGFEAERSMEEIILVHLDDWGATDGTAVRGSSG